MTVKEMKDYLERMIKRIELEEYEEGRIRTEITGLKLLIGR